MSQGSNRGHVILGVNVALTALLVLLAVFALRDLGAHPLHDTHWHDRNVSWKWDSGSNPFSSEGEAALNEWESKTVINFQQSSSSPDMRMASANYGATGWSGLASLMYRQNKSGSHAYNDLMSCTAQLNTHYDKGVWFAFKSDSDFRRAVWCQEIGHCLGLDHSNDGCMGVSYYWFNADTGPVQHNINDVNAAH